MGTGASFTSADIGAKLIAPSIFNAYITEMDEGGTVTEYPNGFKTYESAKVYGWGHILDGYPKFNKIGGTSGRPIGGTEVIRLCYRNHNNNCSWCWSNLSTLSSS